MQLARPVIAAPHRAFGRGQVRVLAAPLAPKAAVSDELKLFATTFAAGFLFVSVLIA
jgi:hypothetical protein